MTEIPLDIKRRLQEYADRYETSAFLNGDPSWFMHQVSGERNQETIAFIASALSYGSRQQFLPKIQLFLDWSDNEPYEWMRNRSFVEHFSPNDKRSFYRLYSNQEMFVFLNRFYELLSEYQSLGDFAREQHSDNTTDTIRGICDYFSISGTIVIPKDTQSACKRICMFMRWMVRNNSEVDLGLWSDFIDKRSLIIPLDTHVLSEAVELGLLNSRTATMSTAIRLTDILRQVFPDDPVKGDFALFGYGVNK